jgi:hypothetical protein
LEEAIVSRSRQVRDFPEKAATFGLVFLWAFCQFVFVMSLLIALRVHTSGGLRNSTFYLTLEMLVLAWMSYQFVQYRLYSLRRKIGSEPSSERSWMRDLQSAQVYTSGCFVMMLTLAIVLLANLSRGR